MLLYINDQLADLDAGQVIAQTKQVNDLNSLENRQANYTNKFKLPKTANNTRIMDFLTLTGNESDVPYQKNECSLYSDNGECFVYKGWAVVSDGGDDYEAIVYDGIIDLYKKVEGKTLADIYLANYTHDKNIESVIASWTGAAPYIYILADYNGNTGDVATPQGPANIDYLVPAMRVEYLWQQIFWGNDFTYDGKIFSDPEFKDLFITIPKGAESAINPELLFESSDYSFKSAKTINDTGLFNSRPALNKFFAQFNDTTEYDTGSLSDTNRIQLKVTQAGSYLIEVRGTLNTRAWKANTQNDTVVTNADIYLALNATGTNALNTLPYGSYIGSNIKGGTAFTKGKIVYLNAGETLSVVIGPSQNIANTTFIINPGNQLTIKLTKVDVNPIDFNDAFADFPIRDFIKEILHRFGLTMYKDKYADAYTFLTPKELIEETAVEDWSSKFGKKLSENYIYGSYAQRNWLRYKYNDKEESHKDGYIEVANKNLEESKNIIASAIYSPEQKKVNYLGRLTNVYRLWDKQITAADNDEPGKIEYKPLDKRYYFIKAVEVTNANLNIYSGITHETATVNRFYRESYQGLSFGDVVQNFYWPLKKLLNKSRIVTAELWLNDTDIISFDFKKRYYIEQLGSYFLMNKINNYLPGKPVKCELIRIESNLEDTFIVKITKVVVQAYLVRVYFETNEPVGGVTLEYTDVNGNLQSYLWENASPIIRNIQSGDYNFKLRAAGRVSNTVNVPVPAVTAIIIP
jgi:hypothetical protein